METSTVLEFFTILFLERRIRKKGYKIATCEQFRFVCQIDGAISTMNISDTITTMVVPLVV